MSLTFAQIYAGLHFADHSRWPGGTLTFSIPGFGSTWSPSSYPPGDEPSNAAYGVLNSDQRAAFVDAVGAWGQLINLELLEVPDNGFSQGAIRVAFTHALDYTQDETAAYAYGPPLPGSSAFAFEGDIWFDDFFKTEDPYVGGFFYETMLHELGHALGLKHPHEDTPLPTEFDNTRYTVMSYTDFPDSRLRYFELEGNSLVARTFIVQPATPMVLDIVAIQGLYGAATDANTGADTYSLDEAFFFIATVFDTGGVDTFDFSDHTFASYIDLTPGAFSSIAYYPVAEQIADAQAAHPGFEAFIASVLDRPDTYEWANNLATSLETVIENVRAGLDSDTVNGNSAANSVMGGEGSDRIFGAAGNDTLDGGSAGAAGNYLRGDDGNDSLAGGANFDDANGNMGNDTVSTGAGEDYCVGGKDNDLLSGGADYDLVYGNLGDDTCSGDDGNDIVRGGQGSDSLSGGLGGDFVSGDRGDDTLTGGAGADVFHSSGDAGLDRVLDFSAADGDRVQLDPGTTFTVSQVGADTVVAMSAGQVVLVGVSMSALTPGWIFGA